MTLNEWLDQQPEGAAAKLARALQVSDSCIYRWRRRGVIPRRPIRLAIKALTQGRVTDWRILT